MQPDITSQRTTPALGLCCCILAGAAAAQSPSNTALLTQLDFNGDRKLQHLEVLAGLNHKRRIASGTATAKRSARNYLQGLRAKVAEGKHPSKVDDLALVSKDVATLDRPLLNEELGKNPNSTAALAFSEVNAVAHFGLTDVYPPATPADISSPVVVSEDSGFRLRRSLKQVLSTQSASSIDDGALFSFSRNMDTSEDQWKVLGTLAYVQKSGQNLRSESFSSVLESTWYTAASFDRVSNSAANDEDVDSLTFAFGHSMSLVPFSNPADVITIAVQGEYNTSFGFDHGIVGGSVNIIPEMASFGINTYNDIGKHFGWTWDLMLHGEVGHVTDPGDNPMLTEEAFVRVGGRAGITVYPGGSGIDNRLALSAAYLHYETLFSDLASPSIFEAELKYQLVKGAAAFLTVNYRNGEIAKTLQSDDTLTAGFAFGF